MMTLGIKEVMSLRSWPIFQKEMGLYLKAYDDLYVASDYVAYFIDDDDINYGDFRVLYHDPLGMYTGLRFSGSSKIYGANVFQTSERGYLEGVVISIGDVGGGYVDCTIRVYKNRSTPPRVGVDPPSYTLSTRVSSMGYYTLPFDSPVSLSAGESFVIVAELRPSGPGAYPLGIEYRIPGVSSNVTILPGESFVSPDGAMWEDLYNYYSSYGYGNFSLKALVSSYTMPPPSGGGGGCSSGEGSIAGLLLLLPLALTFLRRK